MSNAVNGYALRITPATIEGFLALYGDHDRYPGDSAAMRRLDVRAAASKLRLLPGDDGSVIITATRTDEREELSLFGFLETYERNSEDGFDAKAALSRVRAAITLLLSREGT